MPHTRIQSEPLPPAMIAQYFAAALDGLSVTLQTLATWLLLAIYFCSTVTLKILPVNALSLCL